MSVKCTKEIPKNRPGIREIKGIIQRLKSSRDIPSQIKRTGSIISDITARRIGVCGASIGVGTTHIAFYIAKELSALGRRVAYVSLDREGDIRAAFIEKSESLKNVQIYNGAYEEDISYLIKKGFDNLIIDFGKIEEFTALFYSCDEKLIVVQNNFIKNRDMEEFLINHQDEIGEKG